ncbi:MULTISPECIES: hypothetical protein [Enterobacter cloacae complex]|uniref:hypothetical protein n=1 Tax=Enterobacter cloacae complex TaxID=354276 RepID=UPI0013CFDA6C|nr:hypothetical protein [Enterobacter cloacae]EKY3999560.1 hypothetical protein [Enterobacter roggenkampii]HEG1825678.1 hypothetical protein [Enterobacter cloacae]
MNLAAFWENLLSGKFSNIFHAIAYATWANVWSAVTGISTFLAVVFAVWAMIRWRKQDELKVKLAFKQAISHYAYCLYNMPGMLQSNTDDVLIRDKKAKLESALEACSYAWFNMEGLLAKNETIKVAWQSINDKHPKYLNGQLPAKDIGGHCATIMTAKFIFK